MTLAYIATKVKQEHVLIQKDGDIISWKPDRQLAWQKYNDVYGQKGISRERERGNVEMCRE